MQQFQRQKWCTFVGDVPVPQPLVSVAVAAGVAAGAVGSGGGQTEGHPVEVCPMRGAASWGWTSAERPPLKSDSRKRIELRHILEKYANRITYQLMPQWKHLLRNIFDHYLKPSLFTLITLLKEILIHSPILNQLFNNELFKARKVSNSPINAKWTYYKNYYSKQKQISFWNLSWEKVRMQMQEKKKEMKLLMNK